MANRKYTLEIMRKLDVGEWDVIEFSYRDKFRADQWLCKCTCGTKKNVLGTLLRTGKTKSCHKCSTVGNGKNLPHTIKHGKTYSRVWNTWQGLRARCSRKGHKSYHNYGGRGITFDPRWSDFEEFYKDMGDPPEGCTLDRIDNDGDYCKDNCKWSTPKEQANNRGTRRKNEKEK